MSVDRTRWQKSWPKRLADFPHNGLRVRTRRSFKNGYVAVGAGALGRVRASSVRWDKLTFQADECSHCLQALRVGGISPDDVELIDSEGKPLP
ncbi:MAG TPA: hypothetical protein VGB70_12870 [Allosphingosinicella sp.]|jgi:hypothetical protein